MSNGNLRTSSLAVFDVHGASDEASKQYDGQEGDEVE